MAATGIIASTSYCTLTRPSRQEAFWGVDSCLRSGFKGRGKLSSAGFLAPGVNSLRLRGNTCPRPATAARSKSNTLSVSAVLAERPIETLQEQITREREVKTPKSQVNMKKVFSIILGGGAGTRLNPLTLRRAKPAVPLGGAYRLIDVPMSNCINSGINKIYVLTQFNSTSLNRHLSRTYNLGNGSSFGDGYVEVLAAAQRPGFGGDKWFGGTADAVRQYLWLLEDAKNKDVEEVVILSGDHLYRMDYEDFVQKHKDSGADITVSCVPMDDSRASDYGLMKINDKGRIHYFNEKPKGDELQSMQVDTTVLGLSPDEAKKKPYIASMGIYVFKKSVLSKLLKWRYPLANDFGSEIIPQAAKEFYVHAYLFNDYWEDIGTIKSFFDANLALTSPDSKFSFYDAAKPTYTSARYLPPTKIERCRVKDSIVSHGCFLRDCSVENSVIGIRSRLESGCDVKRAMIMGADFYETDPEASALQEEGKVPLGIGANTKLRNCIVDKNARIGSNVVIANTDNVFEAARPDEGFYIRSGITVICKNAVIQNGTVI
ncbi:glucose-1-phosphate adenylyltransferase large subunit 1 isoform X2 [Physcomitrium patens]|uniref:glucose-1-phosphate adenylyltransferase large subunit 1 isoform X2 n=1 Tax=Physcomitrium patens TaxID=3218 RepID=UPI000D16581F|nr:glucose-1-phosphate adenylyltransferase large subunit 1-like isoform X2 [Physcomitrium patens]|eukprot:XP_024367955.1 glucose-1-phosphate adenylyltransferase large subunit 1-like isoform X2 [Physcomitrella patens]